MAVAPLGGGESPRGRGIGAIIGVIAYFCVPGVLETQNVLVAIVLGAASGLSATGTNQAVKQLTSKSNTNKTE